MGKSDEIELLSGTDFISTAQYEYDFLQSIANNPSLFTIQVIKHAIFRYEAYWLPFAGSFRDNAQLAAPLDIAWIWHVHMLSPYDYETDCITITGKPVDHVPLSLKEREQALQYTKAAWTYVYPGRQFELDLRHPIPANFRSRIRHNLVNACLRQRLFIYQVSLPHYRDKTFLITAFQRYLTLLKLKRDHPKKQMLPCYDIEFMWYTHLMHSKEYKEDTEDIFGEMLDHDDSVSDRTSISKLKRLSFETEKLWMTEDESFAVSGGMFRGEPPMNTRDENETNKNNYKGLANRTYTLQLLDIQIHYVPKGKYKLSIVAEGRPNGGVSMNIFEETFKITNGKLIKHVEVDKNNVPFYFTFNTETFSGLTVTATQVKKKVMAKGTSYTMFSAFPPSTGQKGNYLVVPLRLKSDKTGTQTLAGVLHIAVHSIRIRNNELVLRLADDKFTGNHHIGQILHYPNLMAPEVPFQQVVSCQFSENTIQTKFEKTIFKWRLIHCKSPKLSTVEVCDLDGLVVATGHTVGNNMLPTAEQVSNPSACCTLNPDYETAMLIRGASNDWGVLTSERVPSFGGESGSEGQDSISFQLFLMSYAMKWVAVTDDSSNDKLFTVEFDNYKLELDIGTGDINFSGPAALIPQTVCLACCIVVMSQTEPIKLGESQTAMDDKHIVRHVDTRQLREITNEGTYATMPASYTTDSYRPKNYFSMQEPLNSKHRALSYSDLLRSQEVSRTNDHLARRYYRSVTDSGIGEEEWMNDSLLEKGSYNGFYSSQRYYQTARSDRRFDY